jgi:hypothetical protein
MLTISQSAGFSGWIDPDTVSEHKTMISYTDGKVYIDVYIDIQKIHLNLVVDADISIYVYM